MVWLTDECDTVYVIKLSTSIQVHVCIQFMYAYMNGKLPNIVSPVFNDITWTVGFERAIDRIFM